MIKSILWLDDDTMGITEFIKGKPNNIEVTLVDNVTEAENEIRTNIYDMLIVDIMIPIKDKKEEKLYPPDKTEKGHETGFYFFQRNKKSLKNKKVFVFTIRIDQEIKEKFIKEGLSENNFATKPSLRTPNLFWNKVIELL